MRFSIGEVCEVSVDHLGNAWVECQIMRGGVVSDWLVDCPAAGNPPNMNYGGLWGSFEKYMRKLPDKDTPTEWDEEVWSPKELVLV